LNSSVVKDPEIVDYISSLGNNLIDKGSIDKTDIYFFVLNDRSINAFAMLGDVIGVHTGLILAANSESELAAVLSHEIAHITQKHLLRLINSQQKNSYKSYLSLAFAILVARSNPQLASGAISFGNAAQVQNLLDYTRENEKEADRVGLEILSKSGYDPSGMISFFDTLQTFNEFSTGPSPSFLRTHPPSSDRISDIQDRLKVLDYKQIPSSQNFYFVKAKIKAFSGDFLNISNIFKSEIKLKMHLDISGAYFGLTYALLRQNKIKEARENFNALKKFNINNPMIYELEANLLKKENKNEEAYQIYKKAIDKYPYYRSFIYGLSEMLINSNNSLKAIDFIKSKLDSFGSDSRLYELLAKAYSINGKTLLEHESLANAFYYMFNINDAISQMDLATKTNSEDFFDKSRVEHRLKELKREAELMNN